MPSAPPYTDQGSPGGRAPVAGVETSDPGARPATSAAAGEAAAALENSRGNSSGWTSKYAVLDELAKFTTIPGQATCMTVTRAPVVTVGRREGQVLLGDVLPCGKRLCPNCGPRIQAVRREELRETVEAARARGWGVYFLTLTLRHSKSDELSDLLDGLDASLRALMRGGFWSRLRRRHGIKHYVRVTEVQQGGEHGWHPHFHLLLMLDPAEARDFQRYALQDDLLAEWQRVVTAAGFSASRNGQALLEPTDDHLTRMASYFSKEMAESLAWEMTAANSKDGKNGSRSPAQLLLAAVDGDGDARAAWTELEQATRGRRMLSWSVGCRQDLKLDPPTSADEASRQEEPPAPAEALLTISRHHWEKHATVAGFREALAAVVVTAIEPEEVRWWLSDRGIPSALMPDRVPFDPAPPVPGPPGAEWLVTL